MSTEEIPNQKCEKMLNAIEKGITELEKMGDFFQLSLNYQKLEKMIDSTAKTLKNYKAIVENPDNYVSLVDAENEIGAESSFDIPAEVKKIRALEKKFQEAIESENDIDKNLGLYLEFLTHLKTLENQANKFSCGVIDVGSVREKES